MALVTARLASRTSEGVGIAQQGLDLTRESIEAQDRPFLIATPEKKDPAIAYIPVGPPGKPPTDTELNIFVTFENWGKGPAILDGLASGTRTIRSLRRVSGRWNPVSW